MGGLVYLSFLQWSLGWSPMDIHTDMVFAISVLVHGKECQPRIDQ